MYKTLFLPLTVILLLGFSSSVFSETKNKIPKKSFYQQLEVNGKVYDSNRKALPFASIVVKGTNRGTTTDSNGNFTLKVPKETGTLIFSFTGFKTREVKYVAGKSLKIILKEDVTALDEVTVVAYGRKKTKDIIGSVSSIKAEDIKNIPSPSIENVLQGKLAGVNITNLSGGPGGGGSQVVIRGYNSLNQPGINDGSPLYVIDGVPVKSRASLNTGGINTLAGLDPKSIESVEVLKDAASAALYGSRAGNGVVLITTKKGAKGKPKFSVNVSQSLSFLPETPDQTIGRMERKTYIELAKNKRIGNFDWATNSIKVPNNYKDTWGWFHEEGAYDFFWKNGNVVGDNFAIPNIVQDSLNTFYNNKTNWWKYAFQLGAVTDLNAQISGGSENSKYFINTGLYKEKGIMINSEFVRTSVLANLDFNLTTKLKSFLRLNLAYMDRNSGGDNGSRQGLTFDPKSTPSALPGKGTVAEEEALNQLREVDRENVNYNIRLNAGIKYDILKSLTFSSSAAIDYYSTRSFSFTPTFLRWNNLSESSTRNTNVINLQTENLLNYKKTFNNAHNIDLLGGVTFNRDILHVSSAVAEGGPTNQIKYVGEGWPKLKDFDGFTQALQYVLTNKEEQAMLSFLSRFSYDYKRKYLLEASVRADGSSVFGVDSRWGVFPAVALGWVFSKEDFMSDLWWLNFAKLRLSAGRSGQKFQSAYLAHGIMSESNTFLGSLGLMPQFMANTKLTWEKNDQYDIGLDVDIFESKYQFKLDYYYKDSHGLLMQSPLPGNFFVAKKGFNNSSAISNQGIEFDVRADLVKKENFTWSVNFNIARNWNLFRQSYEGRDLPDKVLGRSVYGIYTYKDEGIVQKESDIPYYYDSQGKVSPLSFQGKAYPLRVGGRKIKDQNYDGIIDDDDMYYAGSAIPQAYGGFGTQITWNNFSFNALFSYTINRKMMNMVKNSAFSFTQNYGVLMNDLSEVTFWQKPGDVTDYPSLEFSDAGYLGQFDGNIDSNIENVSYVRLKQLNVTYKLPKTWLTGTGIDSANLFLGGENLFLLSNYSGVDPEVVNPYTGKDLGDQYPLSRKITIGANINF